MRFLVRFPQISNPIVRKIHVREGYIVKRNALLVEVETEKANIQIRSEVEGVVLLIMVRMNQQLKEGDGILIIKQRH